VEEALEPRQQPGVLVLTAELEAARGYAEQSRAPATLRAYRRDFKAFRAWCDKRGPRRAAGRAGHGSRREGC